MFSRSFSTRDRASKAVKQSRGSSFAKDSAKAKYLKKSLDGGNLPRMAQPALTSEVIKFVVGKDQRLFAAHEDVLKKSPWMQQALKVLFYDAAPRSEKCIDLSDEEPETFSMILEYLYKGDYSPRLLHDKRTNVWYIDGHGPASPYASPQTPDGGQYPVADAVMFHSSVGDIILRDTAVYCAAERFGLDDLKRLALRKQGLHTGIEIGTILRSMRYAYANTPETDSRLRAHYLALIVRSRKTFKRSGTMQMEMAKGGNMWFDLFVAMCNHLDDVSSVPTPRTV